ncbi:helix-turn-helix transcriptional regulator [Psychrobacter fozii]|uniref:AlpA family transcriptional regulator n=1 Tax=Psychrobacter fozii TaxID=198480 RepID=A0A2V4UD12_9GAMM|nr:AlpA family phage regulatory protein [Psychrobacter fozii]PYE38103.1 AlpA family transcriptional regulator [Psychrobacter fozii]
MTLNDQYLRMADLANQPARAAKTHTTKSGQKRNVTTKPATRGITGFSTKHIYHLIKNRQFPAPIKIGHASVWRLSEINKWLDSHSQANNSEA